MSSTGQSNGGPPAWRGLDVYHALSEEPPKPQERVEREVWAFVARAAGVDEV